jgi:hypothetical protein
VGSRIRAAGVKFGTTLIARAETRFHLVLEGGLGLGWELA